MALALVDPPDSADGLNDEAEWERRAASIDRKHMEVLGDQWKLMRERLSEHSQVLLQLKRAVGELKSSDAEKQEAISAEKCAREAQMVSLQDMFSDLSTQLTGERTSRQRQLDSLLETRDASVQKLREQVMQLEEGMGSTKESLEQEKVSHAKDVASLQEAIMLEGLARKGHMTEVGTIVAAETERVQQKLQEHQGLLDGHGEQLTESLGSLRAELEEVTRKEIVELQHQVADKHKSLQEETLSKVESLLAELSKKHETLHVTLKEEILEDRGRHDRGLSVVQQFMAKLEGRLDGEFTQELINRKADADELRRCQRAQEYSFAQQVATIEEVCETLSGSIAQVRGIVEDERHGTWDTDLQDLRGRVEAERLAREGHVNGVRELLIQERRTREVQKLSMDERLLRESEARREQAKEFEGLLTGEREARERLRETLQVSVSNSLSSQRTSVREDVERLQKFLAEATNDHATRHADLKENFCLDLDRTKLETEGIKDALGRLEKRVEQDLSRFKEAQESGAQSFQELLREEKSAREGHVIAVKDKLQRMEGDIQEERTLRETALRIAHEALSREGSMRELATGGLREALAGEARAREAQLQSVHDMLSSEASAREADFEELRSQLAADRAARQRLQTTIEELVEGRLQEQTVATIDVQRRLADAAEASALARRTAEDGLSAEAARREQQVGSAMNRLSELEKRFSEERSEQVLAARDLKELVSRQCSAWEGQIDTMHGLLEAEREARELELCALRGSLMEEAAKQQASLERELSTERVRIGDHTKKLLEAVEAVDVKVHSIVDQEQRVRNASISELQDCLSKLEVAVRECSERERAARVAGLRELQEHLFGERQSREALTTSLREQLERERRALVAQMGTLGDRLTSEVEARRVEAVEAGERLAGERAVRDREREGEESRIQELRTVLQDRWARLERRMEEALEAQAATCTELREDLTTEADRREQAVRSIQGCVGELDKRATEGLRTEVSEQGERLSELVARLRHERATTEGRLSSLEDVISSLEKGLGQEHLARQGEFRELQEILGAERTARQDQLSSLQGVLGKERAAQEVQLASVHELLAEEMAARQLEVTAARGALGELRTVCERGVEQLRGELQDNLKQLDNHLSEASARVGTLRDDVFGEKGLRQQLSSVLKGDLCRLEDMLMQALRRDEEAREAESRSLRDLIGAEGVARQGGLAAVQSSSEQDRKACEVRVDALHELILTNVNACKASVQDLDVRLNEQKSLREKEPGVSREMFLEKVQQQDTLERRVAELQTRLADTCQQHASRHADLSEDILGECRSREQDSQALRGALQALRRDVEKMVDEESKERETNLLQVQEQMREERSAREEMHAETFEAHTKQADAMLETLTRDLDARETRLREVEERLVTECATRKESVNNLQHSLDTAVSQSQEAIQELLSKEGSAVRVQLREQVDKWKIQLDILQEGVARQCEERAAALHGEMLDLRRTTEEMTARHAAEQVSAHEHLASEVEQQGMHICSLRDGLKTIEVQLDEEKTARQTDVAEIQAQLNKDSKARERHMVSVKELFAKEKQAHELHLNSVQEFILREDAHIQELPRRPEEQVPASERQDGSFRERIDGLRRLIGESIERHSTTVHEELSDERGKREQHVAALVDRLERLEVRLESELHRRQPPGRELDSTASTVASRTETATSEAGGAASSDATLKDERRSLASGGGRAQSLPTLVRMANVEVQVREQHRQGRQHSLAEEKCSDDTNRGAMHQSLESVKTRLRNQDLTLQGHKAQCEALVKELQGLREKVEQQGGALQTLLSKEHDAREEHSRALLEFLEGLLSTGSASSQERPPSAEAEEVSQHCAAEAVGRGQLDAIRGEIQAKLREQHASIEDRVTYLEQLLNESVNRCASMQATIRNLDGERGQHENCVTNLMEHLRKLEKRLEEEIRKAHDDWEADVYELQELVGVEILRSRGGRPLPGSSAPHES